MSATPLAASPVLSMNSVPHAKKKWRIKMKKRKKNKTIKQKPGRSELKQRNDDEVTDSVLRFTPYAWAKLQWFCHCGDTEIGGFGVTAPDDLLLIEDFVTVKQSVTCVSVEFDDEAVADFFDDQVDAGRKLEQFGRVWAHTHPGNSPHPSGIDEQTFTRVFGHCQWAVMFVLAKQGKTYARLRFNVGPKGETVVPVQIDFTQPFEASNHEAWQDEYDRNIQVLGCKVSDSHPWEQPGWDDSSVPSDPTIEQEELELLARTQDMSPDELDDFFNRNEVWL